MAIRTALRISVLRDRARHSTGPLRPLAVAAAAAVMILAATAAGAPPAAASPSALRTAPAPAGTGPGVAAVPNGALIADSCTSPAACTAVGYRLGRSGVGLALAERWNGTNWRVQATPNPAGATDSSLHSVSCASADACTAVGYYANRAGVYLTLAERWNGVSWRVQPTPNPGRSPSLNAISCTSARACTAVGLDISAKGPVPLAERWNGVSWRVQPIPNPAGAETKIFAVSCRAANACTAVGLYATPAGDLTLAEQWNGVRWRIQPTPSQAGALISALSGVSCTSADACTADGYYFNAAFVSFPLTERWNGVSWRIQRTPDPVGATFTAFAGLSCSAASACTAVGYYDNGANKQLTLAERWNGVYWRIQPTPNQAGAPVGSALSGVSCVSGRSCVAAGSYSTNDGDAAGTLAEGWNGTSWRIQG